PIPPTTRARYARPAPRCCPAGRRGWSSTPTASTSCSEPRSGAPLAVSSGAMNDDRSKGTVCVTGGAGFIGSHVADAFLAEGRRVLIIDNLSGGKRENVPQGAELHVLDIRSKEAAELVRE